MQLRQALDAMPDVRILYVMASRQVDRKARSFIDGNHLRDRVTFLLDPESVTIDQLGLRKSDPDELERGVPHPTTYVLDPDGIVRLVDVREDYHIWLDPAPVIATLEQIGRPADQRPDL